MPEVIKKQVEAMGRKNKQDRRLRFSNKRNEDFNWSLTKKETEPLTEDNAVKIEETDPDIPVKIPGVVMQEQVPTVETPPDEELRVDLDEERAAAAVHNANFGRHEAAVIKNDAVVNKNCDKVAVLGQHEIVFNVMQ